LKRTHYNTLQHTATHCNTLQHTATHCNTLQHTATHCSTLQHIAISLQHAATRCNTRAMKDQVLLQHTGTLKSIDVSHKSTFHKKINFNVCVYALRLDISIWSYLNVCVYVFTCVCKLICVYIYVYVCVYQDRWRDRSVDMGWIRLVGSIKVCIGLFCKRAL